MRERGMVESSVKRNGMEVLWRGVVVAAIVIVVFTLGRCFWFDCCRCWCYRGFVLVVVIAVVVAAHGGDGVGDGGDGDGVVWCRLVAWTCLETSPTTEPKDT